jgi:methylmalonyl-CoA mutase C-terminal domain/subunit
LKICCLVKEVPDAAVTKRIDLDGHDRGAKIIARALRDAGMEVIYTGLHQTPEQIAETVIQEDADAIGLSILSGAHMTLVPRVVELLKAQGAEDVVITVGGTIPADDVPELKKLSPRSLPPAPTPTRSSSSSALRSPGERLPEIPPDAVPPSTLGCAVPAKEEGVHEAASSRTAELCHRTASPRGRRRGDHRRQHPGRRVRKRRHHLLASRRGADREP